MDFQCVFWNGRTEKHQTSTAVFLAGWKNWVTQPLPRSLCAVSTSTPKPRAEGSSPSAPAKKPAETLGFRRFSFCMCCMAMVFTLVRTLGFLIWFYPSSTVLIPSSTRNAPDFGCFRLKSGAFRSFCPLLTYKISSSVFVHPAV